MTASALVMTNTLSAVDVDRLTDRIAAAQDGVQAIPKLTDDYPGMTLGDGYAVQLSLLRRRMAEGQRHVGWKAGLTSKAKMDQMGVRVPTVGFLLASMLQAQDQVVQISEMVHPRVECEIAFVTSAPLSGPHCTGDAVLAATEHVVAAIEIIDSRFSGFKFDLPSVVADNSSSARYAVGQRTRLPKDLSLSALGVVLEKNGQTLATASSAAVMGHPAQGVAMLVNVLHELGLSLPAGSFVMSGGITEAFAVQPGDVVSARLEELGDVTLRFA